MSLFQTEADESRTLEFLSGLETAAVAAEVSQPVKVAQRRYVAGAMDMDPSFDWVPRWAPPNSELILDTPLMRSRARELVENDGLAMGALNAWTRMVVGNGIPTFSDILDDSGNPIEDLNDAVDDFYELAMEEMDLDDDVHHYEQQRLAIAETVCVGDFLFVEHDRPASRNKPNPVRFQQLEIEHLDTNRDRTKDQVGTYIEHGIERGLYNQPLKYWLRNEQPSLGFSFPNSEAWLAEQIVHGFWKCKPSQRIGVTWFAAIVKQLVNLASYMTSEIRSAGYASKFALAVMRKNGYGGGIGDGGLDDRPAESTDTRTLQKMFGPVVADLQVGEDLKVISHGRPGSEQAVHWLKFFMTVMASGIGLSTQALTRETTGTFAGAKGTRLCDQEGLFPVYDWFVRRMPMECRRRVLSRAFLDGKFSRWVQPAEFRRQRRRFLRALVPQPRLAWLDPNKEVAAILDGIAGGILDYSVPWGVQGTTWRKGMRMLAQQRAYAKSIGLELPDVNPVAAGASDGPSVGASAKRSRPDRLSMLSSDGGPLRSLVQDAVDEHFAAMSA